METDFIVIGSGLAGLTSSLILANYGKVLLVTKGKLSDGSTNWAQGGIACAVEASDSWKKHMKDTLIAGAYHNDKKAVEFIVKNAPTAIDWLAKKGVKFEKEKEKYKTGREGGHSYNRILHATDFTGKVIEMILVRNVRKNKNIKIWQDTLAVDLLIDKGCCLGVKVIRNATHAQFLHHRGSPSATPEVSLGLINCYARATILATGGLGQIYQWTTNPHVATGDGIAMAYRAGAKLKDMEFIQFHPTALKDGRSPLFLLSEALRGEGAWLVKRKALSVKRKDGEEERFMRDYDKRMELAPRNIVARAIFNEQKKGYTVYLDIRHKGKAFLRKRFPNIYKELKKRGFDLAEDLIPVTPAAHFSCGGVVTDLYGRTNIKNLFAFGEVAATGVHGANRLASNSLLESVVFPLRLAKCFSGFSTIGGVMASQAKPATPEVSFRRIVKTPERLIKVRKNLQKLMWEKVGIVRSLQELKEARKQIIKWERELRREITNRELLELKNMLLVGRFITEAALKRKKSIGAHFITR